MSNFAEDLFDDESCSQNNQQTPEVMEAFTYPEDTKSNFDKGLHSIGKTNHVERNCAYPYGPQDEDPLSPDISLSSQTTLKYSDVEQDIGDHDTSHESSDSIETLEDIPGEDKHIEINKKFLQQLSLTTQNVSGSSLDSIGKHCSSGRTHTSSYSDSNASSDSHEVISDSCSLPRPDSLPLPYSLKASKDKRDKTGSFNSNSSQNSNHCPGTHTAQATHCDKSVSLQEQGACFIDDSKEATSESSDLSQGLPQGTITRQGAMIQFVANDLTEKIKLSSPKAQSIADSDSWGSRRSSVRSIISTSSSVATSSGVSRSPSSQWQQSPDDIPPIDAAAVVELEARAQRVADNLDLMMGNIRNNLHKMSAITIGCQEAYKRSVDITCDSVDGSIKAMYALMAKCEELSTSMKPVEQLAAQIKEIKRILELFESQLSDK